MSGTAWLYFHGTQAGLDMETLTRYPMGFVLDMISCWQIERLGYKQRFQACGSLAQQMPQYYGR